MRRRDFNLGALGVVGLAASGCTLPKDDIDKIAAACAEKLGRNEPLRIDMHCHLLNLNDADGAAFLNRRFTNQEFLTDQDESARPSRFFDRLAQYAFRLADGGASIYTHTLEAETEYLESIGVDKSYTDFCRETSERERALLHSDDADGRDTAVGAGRATGFFSHRLRNASYMMAAWPQVDIFTPSMVDFYEGRIGSRPWPDKNADSRNGISTPTEGQHKQEHATSPTARAKFFRQLHIATRGKFIPLVCFHPQRQMHEAQAERKLSRRELAERRKTQLTPLDLVRKSVEEWGFIGVKVHPSSGFDPYDNSKYGCSNTRFQWQPGLSNAEEDAYQQAMEKLYDLCAELDVPILTHASDGLAANPSCMHRSDDPTEWTGSTTHWIKALEGRRAPDVCFAHFASRFKNHLDHRKYMKEGGQPPPPQDYTETGELIPSAWLAAAITDISDNPNTRVWLDLSHMVDEVYSQARLNAKQSNGLTVAQTSAPASGDSETSAGKLAIAFSDFLKENSNLAGRTMYGTDAHMPDVSRVGPKYLQLMEQLIENAFPRDSNQFKDIMGRNAAKFFGLEKGSTNRGRLEAFYKKHKVDAKWMERVDAA